MGATAVFCYALTWLLFALYLFIKLVNRKYIFSIFNISLFIYCFSVFLSPIFYSAPEAWTALDVTNFERYFPYLDKSVTMNCIGLILTFTAMLFFEFNGGKRVCAVVEKWSGKLKDGALEIPFYLFAVLWYLIVFAFNGNLPLLNGGRDFYYNTAISPVYLALNELMLIYSLYFGVRAIYGKKDYVKFLIAVLTLMFTGNRGPVLVSVLVPIAMLFLYGTGKAGTANGLGAKKLFKLLLLFLAVGFFGLALGFLRDGRDFDLKGIFSDLLYGNTFSDIRDGAFILSGFEKKFGGDFLYGKTYLAGIISFIPSGLSQFRLEWSYGRMTTYMLFGWENHFGLRGGNAMEAYMNFGYFGVFFFGILQGVLYAQLEKVFYYKFCLRKIENGGKELLIAYVLGTVNSCLACTSGMYNVYVDLLFLLLIVVLSGLFVRQTAPKGRPARRAEGKA